MSLLSRDTLATALIAWLAAAVSQQAAMLAAGVASTSHASAPPPLRVCADPNNLPFSNEAREGFENRLADLIAAELGTTVEYTWWAQRRGFVRSTLSENRCDVVLGVPAQVEMLRTTSPYYRSTYVFVTRASDSLELRSLDDPRLRTLRIGVQLIGDDGANTPPSHALASRGITDNVVGYTVYGDYAQPNPPARIIEALARGDIDVALAWGPMAAYFAARQNVALTVTAIPPEPPQPFQFDIAMGVRRGDDERLRALEAIVVRRRGRIDAILEEYGVPRVDRAGS